MKQFSIDKNKPIPKLELSLHKPNEEQVGSLSGAFDRSGKFSYGRYNELEITVPKYVERKHGRVIYKEFDIIRDKYLVKATYGELFSEYLVVTKIHKFNDGIPKKRITMRSRQYELNGKIFKKLEALSYTPEEIITLALENTNWTTGSIDPDLIQPNADGITPRRSFDETKITSINLIYKVAEAFSGIMQFDTFNRTVSIAKPENAEIDYGLTASYGKYVKSLDEDIDAESTTTRLFIYGKDELSINEVNPTGLSYIEDYSYYMQGYETDENDNVISSSPYMSDSLCQALIDFSLLLISKDGIFKNLLNELEPVQDNWTIKITESYELETDLLIIEDNLDIAKASGEPTEVLKQQKSDKEAEISLKQSELDDINIQIQMIENDIQDLRNELSLENNFTPEQIKERNDYIVYGEWSDPNYFEVSELYEKGKKVMKKMREPKRDLDLSLIQFLETVESQRDWNRIGLGYTIRTSYDPLDIEFKALITEMSIGFDDQTMGISISNVDYKSNKNQFLEMLYGTAVSTADRVKSNANDWTNNIDKTDYLAEFLENPWETSRQRIKAGTENCVDISRRGIIINDPNFPNEQIIMQAGVLALSLDGGESWSTSISPYGVIADEVKQKTINSKGVLTIDY